MKTEHGEIQSVTVIGRRWFERTNGNTYHTAQVFVNGRSVWKSQFTYGYGSQYEQTAAEWLEANGYMPGRESFNNGAQEMPWRYYHERNGVEWASEAIDVPRKRDL